MRSMTAVLFSCLVSKAHVFHAPPSSLRLGSSAAAAATAAVPRMPQLAALRPAAGVRAAPLRAQAAAADDEDYYRTLGLSTDANYDEITDKYIELTDVYAGDQAQLDKLETAKEKVLAAMLRKRMEGSKAQYEGLMAREDRPPTPVTPLWEIANDYRKKLFGLPTPKEALRVIGLLGGLTLATWLAPTTAGTILLINVVSAMGFMYNRGEPDVPRDDFGQIGEIRPMKPKPFILTVAITTACWIYGFVRAKQMVALMAAAPRGFEVVLRTTLISAFLIVPCLFVKVQPLFENDY